MGELVFLLVMGDGCARVVFDQRLAQQGSERVALVGGNGDEAPREQLAMVRRARGNRRG